MKKVKCLHMSMESLSRAGSRAVVLRRGEEARGRDRAVRTTEPSEGRQGENQFRCKEARGEVMRGREDTAVRPQAKTKF